MINYPKVYLGKGRDKSVLRRHPWVFSGAIASSERDLKEGELVQVVGHDERFLGIGHCCSGSLAIKVLTFEEEVVDATWFETRLAHAATKRALLALPNSGTNCYRMVHGEGDMLPGLIVDVYDTVAVIQPHSVGMEMSLPHIVSGLQKLGISNILHKPITRSQSTSVLSGEIPELVQVAENEIKLFVDVLKGQKTGFFIDQRDNRSLLRQYAKGKSVLNVFSYTGGFSLSALAGGADSVVSVDSSSMALDLAAQNVQINEFSGEHESLKMDALPYLDNMDEAYDIIVLDPPAFAKHKSARHRAVKAYQRINEAGLRNVKPGGMLFTFSCSQVVDNQLFFDTIRAAAINVGRSISVLHRMRQPADHPVSIYHPEGEYLKGLVLSVD